jgi:hypothetical protein
MYQEQLSGAGAKLLAGVMMAASVWLIAASTPDPPGHQAPPAAQEELARCG